jgi:hypothetical protein
MDERGDVKAETAEPGAEDLAQFFGTAKEVVERYTHCALCGANLHFTHITDFAHNLTQETAKCPECGVKARQIIHKLQ